MGLFSSKSKSKSTTTTTTNYNDSSSKVSGTVGDLSSNNVIAGGDANLYGYTAEDTSALIENTLAGSNDLINTALKYFDKAADDLKQTTGTAMTQVASAYSGANSAILESQNETKAFLNSLKPYAFYATVAAIAYFVFVKGKIKL